MTRSDKLSWVLAVILCVVIPLGLGYYGLAIVGGLSLAVLAWVLRRDGLL